MLLTEAIFELVGAVRTQLDVLVNVFEILTNEEPNSSVAPTDECHDWWFV